MGNISTGSKISNHSHKTKNTDSCHVWTCLNPDWHFFEEARNHLQSTASSPVCTLILRHPIEKKKRDQTQSTKKWLSVFRPRWPPSLQLCQLSQLPHCLHTLPEKGEGWHSAMGQGKSSANLGSKAIKGQGFPVSCYIRMGFSDDVSTVYPSNRYFRKTGYDP